MDLTSSSTVSSVTQCPVYDVCDSLDWEEVPSDDEYSDVHFDDTLAQNAEIARLTQLLAQRDAELSQKDAELSQLLSQRDAESAQNAEKEAEKARKKAEKAAKVAYDEAKVMEKLTGMSIHEIRIAMMSLGKLVAYRQLKVADDARKVELKAAWMAYKEATLIEKVAKTYEPYKEAQQALKKEMLELKEAEKAQKAAEKFAEKERLYALRAAEKAAEKARKEAEKVVEKACEKAKVVEKVVEKVVDTWKCKENILKVWKWKGEQYVRDWRNFVWRYEDKEVGDFVGAYNFEKNVIEEAEEPEEIMEDKEAELAQKNVELAQKNAELDQKNAELARKNTEHLQLLFKKYKETYKIGFAVDLALTAAKKAWDDAEAVEKVAIAAWKVADAEVKAIRSVFVVRTAEKAWKEVEVARAVANAVYNVCAAVVKANEKAKIVHKEAEIAYKEAGGREKPYNNEINAKMVDPFKCNYGEMDMWEWRGEKFIRDYNNFVWQDLSFHDMSGKKVRKGAFQGVYIPEKDAIKEAKEPMYKTVFRNCK